MAFFARDNYFPSCPAMVEYSQFTDYRTPSVRNQRIQRMNNLVRDDDYRLFLQQNSNTIRDNKWKFLKTNHYCFPNSCIHKYPTSPNPATFSEELKIYNAIQLGMIPPIPCPKKKDWRL